MPAASAHVLVQPREDCHAVRADLEAMLSRDYGITHLTLQVDHLADPAAHLDGHPRRSSESLEPDGHHQAEDPGEFHCEDAHGPAYRPTHNP